jgi:hypothetical protein
MTRADFILAILPPLGAILVERIDLLSLTYLMADADRTLKDESWASDKLPEEDTNVIKDLIAYTSSGASEIAGLTPTFVSAITSGFAILKEIQHWLWPTVAYISAVMIITLIIIKVLRGSTCYAVAEKEIPIPLFYRGWLFKRGAMRTRKQIAAYIIYVVNSLLIILAISVYVGVGGSAPHSPYGVCGLSSEGSLQTET